MDRNTVIHGKQEDVLLTFKESSIDTVIIDPPYGIKFKGKKWDYNIPNIDSFSSIFRVLKPGGCMMCFGGTRTFHRMAVNIEDAGFYIRDTIMWMHGQGFPKSVDISYVIDKKNNSLGKIKSKKVVGGIMEKGKKQVINIYEPNSDSAKKWNGWGTGLKPAFEPILICSKPIEGNWDENAIKHGVAGYHIDGARIGTDNFGINRTSNGRWPTNVVFDEKANSGLSEERKRYFYCAKPTKKEKKDFNNHPTVKPLRLIKYLCDLTKTPDKGVVLDCYGGSGTTAIACIESDRDYIIIDEDIESINITNKRIKEWNTKK